MAQAVGDRKNPFCCSTLLKSTLSGHRAKQIGSLRNPSTDIEKVAQSFVEKGFDVIKKFNLTQAELKQAISDFEGVLKAGGVGIVYYAGHALYRDGYDILLPVDINASLREGLSSDTRGFSTLPRRAAAHPLPLPEEDRIKGAIYLNELLRPIDIIIDRRSKDSGSAVIYSSSRGQVSLDAAKGDPAISPFAKALTESLNNNDVELFDVFRNLSKRVAKYSDFAQIPTIEATLNKEFYFDRPWRDNDIGVLKIIFIDSCRTDVDLESAINVESKNVR